MINRTITELTSRPLYREASPLVLSVTASGEKCAWCQLPNTRRTGGHFVSITPEHPGWEPGWRRYVEHDGARVVLHGRSRALFICFLREDDSHDTHMVTENTSEAERVFGEICEALHQGVIQG